MSGRFLVEKDSRLNRPLLGRGDRVLVTGASGFLGSHLCRRLIECEVEVHAVSRTLEGAPSENLRWWRVDLEDCAATKNLFENVRPHVVFHLSGQAIGDPDICHVLPTFRSQLLTTVHVLTSSSEIGCRRIILTGSLTEPQAGQVDSPPSSPYAASKWASNAFGRMFHCIYQTPVVIVRPFMVYGPNQNPTKVIPYAIQSLMRGDQPKLTSGKWRADWIYVDDVIDGFIAAMSIPGVEGSTIDMGTGQLVSVEAMIRQIVEIMGVSIEPQFGALSSRFCEEVRTADIEHTRRVLGWQPKISIYEGIQRTIEWHRSSSPISAVMDVDCD
ncbi:MAG TPA: NAD(P)-dependent oxidoreductase [Nitrospira sp.]|nr:NAD(P)-dependent oxidoreductase [Nitrospira sp.]